MTERGDGAVINVSSVAGFGAGDAGFHLSGQQGVGDQLQRIGRAVRPRRTGVRVMALCPGYTRTEFHERAGIDMSGMPGWIWLRADDVVAEALRDLRKGKTGQCSGLEVQAGRGGPAARPAAVVAGVARDTRGRLGPAGGADRPPVPYDVRPARSGPTTMSGAVAQRSRPSPVIGRPHGADPGGPRHTAPQTCAVPLSAMGDHDDLRKFITDLAVVHGRVVLSSGREADWYVDLRRVTLHHAAAPLVGRVMLDLTADWEFDAVGGLTLGADPVAMAMLHAAAATRAAAGRVRGPQGGKGARSPAADRGAGGGRPAGIGGGGHLDDGRQRVDRGRGTARGRGGGRGRGGYR